MPIEHLLQSDGRLVPAPLWPSPSECITRLKGAIGCIFHHILLLSKPTALPMARRHTLLCYHGVGPAVAVQSRVPAGEVLPALYTDVDVLWLNLDQARLTSCLFTGDHRRSCPTEPIQDSTSRPA